MNSRKASKALNRILKEWMANSQTKCYSSNWELSKKSKNNWMISSISTIILTSNYLTEPSDTFGILTGKINKKLKWEISKKSKFFFFFVFFTSFIFCHTGFFLTSGPFFTPKRTTRRALLNLILPTLSIRSLLLMVSSFRPNSSISLLSTSKRRKVFRYLSRCTWIDWEKNQ